MKQNEKNYLLKKEKVYKYFPKTIATINVMECRNCYEWHTNTTVFPFCYKKTINEIK